MLPILRPHSGELDKDDGSGAGVVPGTTAADCLIWRGAAGVRVDGQGGRLRLPRG